MLYPSTGLDLLSKSTPPPYTLEDFKLNFEIHLYWNKSDIMVQEQHFHSPDTACLVYADISDLERGRQFESFYCSYD